MVRKLLLRFLFLFFLFPAVLPANPIDRTAFSTYAAFGTGIYKRGWARDLEFCFGYKKFVFGGYGMATFPVYWKSVNLTPYDKRNYYRANYTLAYTVGYMALQNRNNTVIITAGPVYLNERAYDWPDKGSGSAPFFASNMNHDKSLDVTQVGLTTTLECFHTGQKKQAGIGLFLFANWIPHHCYPGITVHFLFGDMR
jgi:hypothetical protein